MDRFHEMQVFTTVVDTGSFAGAADSMALSKQTVSKRVGELEKRLGVRLLHRTTRRLSITSEGEIFLARCRALLAGVDEAEAELAAHHGAASGRLKVNVPMTFGLSHLAPLWGRFTAENPDVMLEVTLTDHVVDLVDEGFDMAVRIARIPSSSLVGRKLASTRMILCASPAYLQARGRPLHPSDLQRHDIIAYNLFSLGDQWEFEHAGEIVTTRVLPRVRTNSGDTCLALARQHRGIVLLPSFLVDGVMTSGELVEVLPEHRSIELGVFALYPSRKFVPAKVRQLVEYLAESFRESPWRN